MTPRRMLPLALAATAALVGCTSGAHSDNPGTLAPGALAPVEPARVTMNDGPVKLSSCRNENGHIVFKGTLVVPRREARDYTVRVEVLSKPYGEFVEDAYAFLYDVPAGSKPVPVEGTGLVYVTDGGTYTCNVLSVDQRTHPAAMSG